MHVSFAKNFKRIYFMFEIDEIIQTVYQHDEIDNTVYLNLLRNWNAKILFFDMQNSLDCNLYDS